MALEYSSIFSPFLQGVSGIKLNWPMLLKYIIEISKRTIIKIFIAILLCHRYNKVTRDIFEYLNHNTLI